METLNTQQTVNYHEAIEEILSSFSNMLVQEGTEVELICDHGVALRDRGVALRDHGVALRDHEAPLGNTQVPLHHRHGGHYLVMVVGWKEDVRVYNTIVHVDIKGDKIWIQKDGTDTGIAKELVALGVAKTNIVLGDRPPSMRKFTPYSPG